MTEAEADRSAEDPVAEETIEIIETAEAEAGSADRETTNPEEIRDNYSARQCKMIAFSRAICYCAINLRESLKGYS